MFTHPATLINRERQLKTGGVQAGLQTDGARPENCQTRNFRFRHSHLVELNPKFEILNPKQIRNPKSENISAILRVLCGSLFTN
jgi:hypothetical protein